MLPVSPLVGPGDFRAPGSADVIDRAVKAISGKEEVVVWPPVDDARSFNDLASVL